MWPFTILLVRFHYRQGIGRVPFELAGHPAAVAAGQQFADNAPITQVRLPSLLHADELVVNLDDVRHDRLGRGQLECRKLPQKSWTAISWLLCRPNRSGPATAPRHMMH